MSPREARVLFASLLHNDRIINRCGGIAIIGLAILLAIWLSPAKDVLESKLLQVIVLCLAVPVMAYEIYAGVEIITCTRRLNILCDHCGKFLRYNMDWRCGVCDGENGKWTYSFLNRCQYCNQAPRAITCLHCNKVNFLDDSNSSDHPACSAEIAATSIGVKLSAEDIHANEVKELERKKEIAERTAALAKAEAELERTRKALASSVERSLSERLEKNFETFRDHTMAVDVIAKRELKHAEEAYRDDKDMLEKMRIAISTWHDNNIE